MKRQDDDSLEDEEDDEEYEYIRRKKRKPIPDAPKPPIEDYSYEEQNQQSSLIGKSENILAMHFVSDDLFSFRKVDVINGKIRLKDGHWSVLKARPIFWKSKGNILNRFKPVINAVYILPHNMAVACNLTMDKEKETAALKIAHPLNLRDTANMQTLRTLLTLNQPSSTMLMYILIGAVLGGIMGYLAGKVY